MRASKSNDILKTEDFDDLNKINNADGSVISQHTASMFGDPQLSRNNSDKDIGNIQLIFPLTNHYNS